MFDLDTGEVLGLHFGGRYHERNYAVPAAALARDDRVIAAGVTFAGKPPRRPDGLVGLVAARRCRRDRGRPTRYAADSQPCPARSRRAPFRRAHAAPVARRARGPRRVTVFARAARASPSPSVRRRAEPRAAAHAGEAIVEALREPDHDTDYCDRKGYDAGLPQRSRARPAPLAVPMPKAAGQGAGEDPDGDTMLHYQNFSLSMHAERRLALFTACNVTKAPELQKPEPGEDYTRRGLSGLGENDQERWFIDPRLDDNCSCPTSSSPRTARRSTRDISCAATTSPGARPMTS